MGHGFARWVLATGLIAALAAGCGGGGGGGECTTGDCDDGLWCNGAESCVAGSCRAGTAPDCDDGVDCTADHCDEDADRCSNSPDHGRCPADQRCDAQLGCLAAPACSTDPDCDDGFWCNGAERCVGGACQPGTPPDCDDHNPCTDDRCDEPARQCAHDFNTAPCDDGDPCTLDDTCEQGVCSGQPGGCQPGCGNHQREPGEQCDGDDLAGQSCFALGRDSGQLGCDADCLFDLGGCGPPIWQWSNPLPTGNGLFDVWAAAADDIFAVGARGTVLHYDGSGWTRMPTHCSQLLYGVWGLGPQQVWAVGSQGTILHYDGRGWFPQESNAQSDLLAIWGPAADDLYAVGEHTTIRHYDGQSWTAQQVDLPPGVGMRLSQVWGAAGDDVYAAFSSGNVDHQGHILHYDGSEWTSLPTAAAHWMGAVWGFDAANVFATGSADEARRFDGAAWSGEPFGDFYALHDLWGSGPQDLYAVGSNGAMLQRGADGWSALDSGTGVALQAISGAAGMAVATGWHGVIVRRPDAQAAWSPDSTGFTESLNDLWLAGPNEVFACGYGGRVFHYDGQQWQEQPTPTGATLLGLGGCGPDEVYAVGTGGVILRYDGDSWTAEESNSGRFIEDVWCSPGGRVWAVGHYGEILSRDEGAWVQHDSHTGRDFEAIWGTADDDIWAVGGYSPDGVDSSALIHHYDGQSWTEYDRLADPAFDCQAGPGSCGDVWLHDVWGSGPDDIWAVGDYPEADMGFYDTSVILHYDGTEWTTSWLGVDDCVIETIWAATPDRAIAAGSCVKRLHNGTWQTQPGPTLTLRALRGTGGQRVWAAGRGGAVLYSDRL